MNEVAGPKPFRKQLGQGFAILGNVGLLITPLFLSLDVGKGVGFRLGVVCSAILSVFAAILGGLIIGGWREAGHELVRGCFLGFLFVALVFSLAFLQTGLPHSTNIAWTIFLMSIAGTVALGLILLVFRRKKIWSP